MPPSVSSPTAHLCSLYPLFVSAPLLPNLQLVKVHLHASFTARFCTPFSHFPHVRHSFPLHPSFTAPLIHHLHLHQSPIAHLCSPHPQLTPSHQHTHPSQSLPLHPSSTAHDCTFLTTTYFCTPCPQNSYSLLPQLIYTT